MLKYKFDVLEKLKEKGYSTYRIRNEKLFAEGTLTKFRKGVVVSPDNLDTLCRLLDLSIGDIIEYVKDTDGVQ